MMKEKEEEKKINRKMKNITKEWENDLRTKIEKEIREEMTTELNGMIVVMEEERKELKNCMEEVKREKELRSEIEREVCEEVTMKCKRMGEVIEKEIKELKTCMEELNKIKQVMKDEIESLRKLRQERGDV